MFVVVLFGCALHTSRAGLVEAADGPVELRTYEGHTFRLHLDEQSAPIRYLGNAMVKVEGTRLGRGFWVKDWYVQDAGDGSGGFVGRLRIYGSRLVIDDRNTRRTLVIADGTAPELRRLVGQIVLVRGHVVGGETIEVAAYRLLAPPAGEE
ncbi:MAG: hypothetical protein Q8P18_30920 [Pseudomonadota bacterium]|nr:hypothetical protein [Pseudomonadota bacterium]